MSSSSFNPNRRAIRRPKPDASSVVPPDTKTSRATSSNRRGTTVFRGGQFVEESKVRVSQPSTEQSSELSTRPSPPRRTIERTQPEVQQLELSTEERREKAKKIIARKISDAAYFGGYESSYRKAINGGFVDRVIEETINAITDSDDLGDFNAMELLAHSIVYYRVDLVRALEPEVFEEREQLHHIVEAMMTIKDEWDPAKMLSSAIEMDDRIRSQEEQESRRELAQLLQPRTDQVRQFSGERISSRKARSDEINQNAYAAIQDSNDMYKAAFTETAYARAKEARFAAETAVKDAVRGLEKWIVYEPGTPFDYELFGQKLNELLSDVSELLQTLSSDIRGYIDIQRLEVSIKQTMVMKDSSPDIFKQYLFRLRLDIQSIIRKFEYYRDSSGLEYDDEYTPGQVKAIDRNYEVQDRLMVGGEYSIQASPETLRKPLTAEERARIRGKRRRRQQRRQRVIERNEHLRV